MTGPYRGSDPQLASLQEENKSGHNKFVVLPTLMDPVLVLNDREANAARQSLSAIVAAQAPDRIFSIAATGLSTEVIEKHNAMLGRRKVALEQAIARYEALKEKNADLFSDWHDDPGVTLVLTRIYRGLSQKQLAERLGMREQQVQRYEADRYRSISLANIRRICATLGVRLAAFPDLRQDEIETYPWRTDKLDPNELRRVLSYVREARLLPERDTTLSDAEGLTALINYATSAKDRFGGTTFLRAGINPGAKIGSLSLNAWRLRISELAREAIGATKGTFDPTDISWLRELVQLSRVAQGPLLAQRLLESKGIVLRCAPAVTGTSLDGAAFLESGVPIIGMTLRHDRTDNFWFTLLHELGHVFLHLDQGLLTGFYDNLDDEAVNSIEKDANEFASSCIVPTELWRFSPARLAKSESVVREFARQLKIAPELIFGKIRKERNNYKIFTSEIGQGSVRHLFFEPRV